MSARKLGDYSTDELLYELLKLTRREQWEADPIRFGREVFSQHFTRSPASMHQAMLRAVTGQAEPEGVVGAQPPQAMPSTRVGKSHPTVNTSLPFPSPLSTPQVTPA